MRIGTLLQNCTKRKAMPAANIHHGTERRKAIGIDRWEDRHAAHRSHGAMKAVKLHRIGREVFKRRFAGNVLYSRLAGFHRVQQFSGDFVVERISNPYHHIAHGLRMIGTQQLCRRSQREMA